eukprot:SAG31_NODE_34744_length_329_cov_7.852174_1_plen_45_part_10
MLKKKNANEYYYRVLYCIIAFRLKCTLTKRAQRIYMSSSLFIGRC